MSLPTIRSGTSSTALKAKCHAMGEPIVCVKVSVPGSGTSMIVTVATSSGKAWASG